MDKREFIKKAGLGSLAIANAGLWSIGCSEKTQNSANDITETPSSTVKNKNWAWINPPHDWTLEDWKIKLEAAKNSGIDTLVLNVYNGKVAYFENNRLPVKEALAEKVIPICKEVGMEFHAWMFTMPCNNENIVKEHPDWFAVNGLGESAAVKPAYVDYYKFLCPHHPEARQFVRDNVNSLASIDGIDGVHFDYVRLPDVILAEALQPKYDIVQDKEYPQYDYCYSSYCRELFKQQSGIDPMHDLADPPANEAWRQFRYDSITNLVNNLLVPEVKKRNKKVTAAVFPNWESVRQEWHRWELDAFLPMLYHNFYNKGIEFIKKHTRLGIERMSQFNNVKPIYSGIFLPALNFNEIESAYQMAIEGGSQGIALYALDLATDEQIKAFGKAIKK